MEIFAPAAPPFKDAPYPAASTAAMISPDEAVPSTPMELVRRLTEQLFTPGTFDTAFSTRAEQAAQLIPVTLYCSIFFQYLLKSSLSLYFISFWRVATSSSMVSSLPSRISRATQVRMWLASSSLLNAFTAALTAADWIRISLQ